MMLRYVFFEDFGKTPAVTWLSQYYTVTIMPILWLTETGLVLRIRQFIGCRDRDCAPP